MSSSRVRIAIWGIGSHIQRNIIPAFERSSRTQRVPPHTRTEAVLNEAAAAPAGRRADDTTNEGWMGRLASVAAAQLNGLLSAPEYESFLAELG